MAEMTKKEKEARYGEVLERIREIDTILGYGETEGGESFGRKAAKGDREAAEALNRAEREHPAEAEELAALHREAFILEEELGYGEEIEKFLDGTD